MKQAKCENNTISHKKSEIKTIIYEFRETIKVCDFRYSKKRLTNLKILLRIHEKIVYDEKEDDIEYLKERVDDLNCLKNGYFEENQYQDKNVKYRGIETIKYLFNDEDEDYSIYLIKINNISHFLIRFCYQLMNT